MYIKFYKKIMKWYKNRLNNGSSQCICFDKHKNNKINTKIKMTKTFKNKRQNFVTKSWCDLLKFIESTLTVWFYHI